MAAADLDTDGDIDFASADMVSDTLTLYRGDGGGGFTPWTVLTLPAGAGPFDILAADVNRDAATDLLVANADNGTVEIFYGKHGAVPGESGHITIAAPVSPRGLAAADFDRDGKIDIAVTGATWMRGLPAERGRGRVRRDITRRWSEPAARRRRH